MIKLAIYRRKVSKVTSLMLAASLVLSLQMNLPGNAAGSGNQLEALEMKFFSHTYPKDGMEERLDRLEQMVFGEGKEGPHEPRLTKLLDTVPLDSAPAQTQTQSTASNQSSGNSSPSQGQTSPSQSPPSRSQAPNVAAADEDDGSGGNYPAVNAIEQKAFNKTFAKEPIATRLGRLETKYLGKVSTSNDLSERMDKLKRASGVDITAVAPPGSEWAEDDEDIDFPSPGSQRQYHSINTPQSSSVPRYGEDGRSFSGRDLRQDFQKAFGRSATGGGMTSSPGNYGMPTSGGSQYSSGSSGSYGMGGTSSSSSTQTSDRGNLAYTPRSMPSPGAMNSMPQSSMPQGQGQNSMSSLPPTAPQRMGLNQQLDALEKQILGKTFSKEGMPNRLDRLEKTVFPQQQNLSQMSLPERVSRLLSVVPAATQGQPQNPQQQIANRMDDDDLDDDGNGIPTAPQRKGGLGKVLNSLGNMFGNMPVGSYTVTGGNMVADPSGYWLDRNTGNLINPATGAVVGSRTTTGMTTAMPSYGYRTMTQGFSPYTTGYPSASPYVTSPYVSTPYAGSPIGPNIYGTSTATPYGTASPYNPYMSTPYGTSYSMPYANPMYGIGGSGIRFGTGFGGINLGGRWP